MRKVEQLIQQYGYPGKSLVGAKLDNTAWLIIQHVHKGQKQVYGL